MWALLNRKGVAGHSLHGIKVASYNRSQPETAD